ncbi:MAG: FAD binding domain-containing protein [Spirochaetales bacterium]|nr:FAD binding domain-containing protein [Spirochaetales bacterium]
MSKVTWVYPKSVDELTECLKNDTRPHGGGTGFMRNVPQSGSLADLSGVGIASVRVTDGSVRIGGAATFTAAASAIAAARPGHIVARALYDAASPALRNRITIGGSLALFPPWSSVVGPLVALDAELTIVGATTGTYPVSEYIGNRELGAETAITEIRADASREWESHWYRFAPTHFNYPLFTVVVLTELDGTSISDCRIVLTGNRGRFKRLEAVENEIRGTSQPAVEVTPADLGAGFPDRQGFSGEYLTHLAAVAITRGLRGAERNAT